jgi:hypothetical protein
MRLWSLILAFSLCAACVAEEKLHSSVSKKDRQAAEQEFSRAIQLQKSGKLDEALRTIAHATQLFPGNATYITALEMLRQQIVGGHLERGNALAEAGDNAGASAEFRLALALDPQNSYVTQRLNDVLPPDDPERKRTMQLLASVDPIDLVPTSGTASIHVRGDTRSLYTQIGRVFGVTFQFDDNMNSRTVRFDLDDVDFYTATRLAGQMTKTFWSPISRNQAIVANDTPEMHRVYERMALRTFYIGNATSATDLTELVNILRTVFEMNLVSVQPSHNTITVRAPRESVEAAASFIDNLMEARPEVLLEIRAMEIDTDRSSQYGLNLPTSFTVFNIPSEIRRVLGADAQPVIDQLNRTGTIDPSTLPTTALANLQGSPLLSPFVFFGKGLGLTGIIVPPISAHLAMNSSRASTLDHVTLRAMDGETATFREGDHFPILTGSFSNVSFSDRGIPTTTSTPQFQYQDLGLTLKAKPRVQAGGEVRLELELEIVGLGTATLNNIPELTNRSIKSNITVKEGEPSVITGAVNDQEVRAIQGYPAIGQVPGLRSVISTNSKQRTHAQILIVIVPHVVRQPRHDQGVGTFWGLSR